MIWVSQKCTFASRVLSLEENLWTVNRKAEFRLFADLDNIKDFPDLKTSLFFPDFSLTVTTLRDHSPTSSQTSPAVDTTTYRGNTEHYRKYETYTLAANTFSYFIYPDVFWEFHNLFKKKSESPKGFVPLRCPFICLFFF